MQGPFRWYHIVFSEDDYTVEPLTEGQIGTAGFVLNKEVFLLTYLYQKIIMIIIIIETRV